MVGTRIGHFHLLALLGRGAMGEVYMARDERLDRMVALKVLPLGGDVDRRRHFEREARALGALSHPGIVGVHGVEQEGDLLLLAMELVEGTPLGALIPPTGMAWDEIVRIGAALAEAIGAAHRQGVIHRDLKPANVMITPEGAVKVLDFGLAKIRRPTDVGTAIPLDGGSSTTIPGTIIGTAHYMSPEQAQGLPVDARSDIFSLGVVLFHMATGRRPFEGDTPLAILSSIIKDTPPPVTDARPDLPPAFGRLVARCLEKDPGRRVQDAGDLATQLRDEAEDRSRAPSSEARSAVPASRRLREGVARWWRWGLAAALVTTIVVAAVWSLFRARTPAPVKLVAARVAVAPFENHTGDTGLDAVGLMVADGVSQALMQQLAVEVVPGPVVLEAWPKARPDSTGRERQDRVRLLATRVGAAVIVSGDYYLVVSDLAFRGRITDARDGRDVAQFGPIAGPRDAPGRAVEVVRQYVVGETAIHLEGGAGVATAGIPTSLAPSAPPMSYDTYRELVAGLDAFGRDPKAAIAHFERVEQLYPYRALVLPWLVLTYVGVGDFDAAERYVATVRGRMAPEDAPLVDYFRARLDGRWLDAYESIRTFQRSMPKHLPTVNTAAGAALAIGRPREALALLSSVDVTPWIDSTYGRSWLSSRADVDHMLGRYEDELKVATTMVRAAPEAARPLVRALAALGRANEITVVVERGLLAASRSALQPAWSLNQLAAEELRAHGHAPASRALAQRGLEWLASIDEKTARGATARQLRGDLLALLGRWREAAAAYSQLLANRPDDIGALAGLGVARARQGDRNAAERASARLARLDRPHLYGRHTYGRARIAAALGQRDRATLLLQQAFAEGHLIVWRVHADPAFDDLRGQVPFDRLVALDQDPAAR